MPHLCLHKGAGIKKDAALREQCTACPWVQGRVFGSFAAGEKSRDERSAASAAHGLSLGTRACFWFFRRRRKIHNFSQ